jgi:hypothetical protein
VTARLLPSCTEVTSILHEHIYRARLIAVPAEEAPSGAAKRPARIHQDLTI